jgi:hypothetical protein
MPKYCVNLFYHGSASYDVEADDEDAAVVEAKRLNNLESQEEFQERLNLDFTDDDVYEVKED